MNSLIIAYIVRIINAAPFGGFRTYIVNTILLILWVALAAFTGHWEIALGFIGTSLSNLFQRKATEGQNDKLIYLESMLEDLTRQLHDADAKGK